MAYELAKKGLEFEFAVRPESVCKAGLLCLDITKKIPEAKVSFGLITQIIGNVDVLINATPVGMYPNVDEQPIHNCAIGRCAAVYDAIYNPLETALVKRAKANGAKAEGGMSMLVWQAAAAQSIWNGVTFEKEEIDKICVEASKELMSK
jgi:shikimate dehydrogenase